MDSRSHAKVWIGPSGWSYPDWHGTVYPKPKPRGFKPLAFIARHFNAVEVNSSFYRVPTAEMTAAWVPQVPADFRFTFKLTRIFTHERDEFPSQRDVAAYIDGLSPVRDADRLGPLLIQFPWSFRFTSASADWLKRLGEAFANFDRFIEVRHASWEPADALACVRRAGGYCNIDQPRLRNCLGPTQHRFGRSAYVRLHGRNAPNWFAENVPGYERYNYLYNDAELREWITRINRLSEGGENTYVFANNHYRGQGVVNALELRAMLEGRRVAVPETLQRTFPRLAAIAAPPREPGLFDPSA